VSTQKASESPSLIQDLFGKGFLASLVTVNVPKVGSKKGKHQREKSQTDLKTANNMPTEPEDSKAFKNMALGIGAL